LNQRRFESLGTVAATAANRFGIHYTLEASRLPMWGGIVDAHTHVNGVNASLIWRDAARAFGIKHVLTQVRLEDCQTVRDALGDMVSFIAFPNFRTMDRWRAMTTTYLEDIVQFRNRFGAKVAKFWNAPRLRELFPHGTGSELVEMDGAWRVQAADLAESLGMMMMVHVADPDTWFSTKYVNHRVFGRKIDQYRGFRVMLDRYKGPWIAAHMGGWPEDLSFLDEMLTGHANLYLDTSATKWVVRALSAHEPARVRDFFMKWKTRILFGSDIVTTDEHLLPVKPEAKHPMADLADSPAAAFDLYSSRYMALRLLLETEYDGESPIADPDLMLVDPAAHGPMSAPRLRGISLPREVLERVYFRNASELLGTG
jgi:hypothetical protein